MNPLVKEFFELATRRDKRGKKIPMRRIAQKAGFTEQGIGAWRTRCNPSVPNLQAALNTIGYQLVIKRKPKGVGK